MMSLNEAFPLGDGYTLFSVHAAFQARKATVIFVVFFFVSLHGIDQHVQLVRSRYHQPTEADPSAAQRCTFDLKKLQEDVIRIFLVGKPFIHDPSQHLRVQFRFKELQSPAPTLDISDIDISVLSGYITTDSGFRVSHCNAGEKLFTLTELLL